MAIGSFRDRPSAALFVITLIGGLIVGCEKTILNVIPPSDLQIHLVGQDLPANSVTLLEKEEQAFEARLTGPDGEPLSGRTVTWSTDDPTVASLTSSGVLMGLAPGSTVARAQVENLRAAVPVTVLQGPTIELSSQLLQLQGPSGGETPLEIGVFVENAGNGSLSGLSASVQTDGPAGEDWLVASLQSGDAPTILLVQVLLENLVPGSYRGQVMVTGPTALNGSQAVQVELEVGEPLPIIDLSPTSVLLVAPAGAFQPAIQEVAVENVGGGTLDGLGVGVTYVSGGEEGWLSTMFVDSGAPTTFDISALARFLAPGTYIADVLVTAASAPSASATVRVTFTVQ